MQKIFPQNTNQLTTDNLFIPNHLNVNSSSCCIFKHFYAKTAGRQAQVANITAAKAVADIIRTCLGPKAMLKMLLDPMGGIVLTNDGHAILREIDVSHPAAKSMIELSRTQDEEVGDGTTTVIILAGEILAQTFPYIEKNIHPVIIIKALKQALKDALEIIHDVSTPVDIKNDAAMLKLIKASIGTKYVNKWSTKMCELSLKAVRTVMVEKEITRKSM